MQKRIEPRERKRPGDGCVPAIGPRYRCGHTRQAERETVKERAREVYRKWYSIAAGKDAESGPQLYGGRRCASPFHDWRRDYIHTLPLSK